MVIGTLGACIAYHCGSPEAKEEDKWSDGDRLSKVDAEGKIERDKEWFGDGNL